ncbi:hypothetical protein TrVE_jg12735 [Triparma verrucosa]|uniref:Uncharacterized protein n=1 Tax=Triparma verrucosa TaxID=1606542 RepID=A0A9W7EZ20_9STRA|nr:hypothetical protein TrVE_jg12735 [Triparma verrucosa]
MRRKSLILIAALFSCCSSLKVSRWTRRVLLSSLFAPAASHAFDNGVPEMNQYKDKKKYPGTPPISLGVQPSGSLSPCTSDALNCFSTSGDAAHLLKPWSPPDKTVNPMQDILETLKEYPPGQSRIDKGGYSIITLRNDYLYVQFESLKRGFIDDVEFSIQPLTVQVRSSSRLGFLDLGVNAKRLNYISSSLRSKGWTAPQITPEEYPDYFNLLLFTFDDYIRSVISPETCPSPAEPLKCTE